VKKIAMAAAALLALAACSSPPKSGYVYDKKFHPAYYWTSMQCAAYDTKGSCTVQVPVQHYQPDSFELCLKADNPDEKGKYAKGCRDVPADEYERFQVGDHYPKPA
jgi:hypothetical protein